MPDTHRPHEPRLPDRCPSGLFGRAAFARAVEAAGARPRWWDDPGKRERRYLEWVEAEAMGLASQLSALGGPEVAADVAAPLRSLTGTLVEDAAWAAARQALPPGGGFGSQEQRRNAA